MPRPGSKAASLPSPICKPNRIKSRVRRLDRAFYYRPCDRQPWRSWKHYRPVPYRPFDHGDAAVKTQSIVTMDCHEFESLVHAHFGPRAAGCSFVADQQCGNDSDHKFLVEADPADEYDAKTVADFVATGKGDFLAGRLRDELARRGVIAPGRYLIEVCW